MKCKYCDDNGMSIVSVGEGYISRKKCLNCKGTGLINTNMVLEVSQ